MKEQDIRKILADKLRLFRSQAGLTAKEVGDKIGKSAKTVSGWEHGRGQPDADTLFALCKVYGIKSMSEFYAEDVSCIADNLPPQEKELLSLYRSMNNDGKDLIIKTVRAIVTGNPDMKKDSANAKAI